MYFRSILWLVAMSLLWGGCSSLPETLSAAIETPDSTNSNTPSSSVADLLRHPPAPGATVEIDAYFSGVMLKPHSIPPLSKKQIVCPFIWEVTLSDQPFPGQLSILNGIRNNALPENAPWLIATTPKATQPSWRINQAHLPYHARLRGHLGAPAFAKCPHADRIFIVEQVVHVYEEQPPEPSFFQMKRPQDFDRWPRYHNTLLGYSVAYPPGWKVEPASESNGNTALIVRSPQLPNYPVVLRVHPYATTYKEYVAHTAPLLRGETSAGVFAQGWVMGGKGSQHLAGFSIEPDAGIGQRQQSVLFSTGDGAKRRTYELMLRYPIGFEASQPLLTNYSAIVLGFQLDKPKNNLKPNLP